MEQPSQQSFNERITRILPEFRSDLAFEDEINVTAETYDFLKEVLVSKGFVMYKNISEAANIIGNKNLIVRREDPRKILELLSNDVYGVGFENERYSNCAEWNPVQDGSRGITNAYMEGMTNLNNVVTLIGFEKRENQDIERLPDATENFHGLERGKVRSFQGEITMGDTAMINLRIPGHLIPESQLTDDEIAKIDEYLYAKENNEQANPVMIYRSFLKNQEEEPTVH